MFVLRNSLTWLDFRLLCFLCENNEAERCISMLKIMLQSYWPMEQDWMKFQWKTWLNYIIFGYLLLYNTTYILLCAKYWADGIHIKFFLYCFLKFLFPYLSSLTAINKNPQTITSQSFSDSNKNTKSLR